MLPNSWRLWLTCPRSFSDGEPVDHVDTEKSRIVMHELEKDWWILAVMSRPSLATRAPL